MKYEEFLMQWLVEKVTVYDERFVAEFKSETKVDVKRQIEGIFSKIE